MHSLKSRDKFTWAYNVKAKVSKVQTLYLISNNRGRQCLCKRGWWPVILMQPNQSNSHETWHKRQRDKRLCWFEMRQRERASTREWMRHHAHCQLQCRINIDNAFEPSSSVSKCMHPFMDFIAYIYIFLYLMFNRALCLQANGCWR
jgi:hypothetical protein